MKRLISAVVWFALILSGTIAAGQTKLDPFFSSSIKTSAVKAQSLGMASARPKRSDPADVFIKTSDVQKTQAAIEAAGGRAHTVVGNIMTASVDPSSLQELAAGADVVFIEAGKPVQFKNDVAEGEIGSTEVNSGTGLPAAYTGRGVIIGVIDTGIDYSHPDFRDADGKSRILAIWDQNRSGGKAPAEIQNSYGTECAKESLDDGSCPLRDVDGHGTHIAGTMAGRNEKFGGVAPDANIVVVSYDSSLDLASGYADTIFSSKICQAAYYVFAKADKLGMPAVVNLSLGTHLGPHDGTSLFEQCLAGLIQGSSGRAIVAAAGNEYSSDSTYTGIHAGFDVNGTAATNFVIRQVSKDKIYYIDLWGAKGSDLSVGLAIHNGSPSGKPEAFSDFVAPGAQKEGTFLKGGFGYTINATESSSALNGKPHVGITITIDSSVKSPEKYSFDLVVKGKGSFDAWMFPDKPAKTIQFTSVSGSHSGDWTYIAGDRTKSVAIPATSGDILAVAAYATRNRWDGTAGCCQVSFSVGALLDFSSAGPSADESATGMKPNIAAPGGMIASALSSFTIPNSQLVVDSQHFMQAGTSMAAPFVSGTIALMFSANPNFTYQDVSRYLTENAYVDSDVTGGKKERWGAGKLDAFATMEKALNGGATGNFTVNEKLTTPETPTSGTSGCSFARNEGGASNTTALGFMMILALASLFRMKSSPRKSL